VSLGLWHLSEGRMHLTVEQVRCPVPAVADRVWEVAVAGEDGVTLMEGEDGARQVVEEGTPGPSALMARGQSRVARLPGACRGGEVEAEVCQRLTGSLAYQSRWRQDLQVGVGAAGGHQVGEGIVDGLLAAEER